jgi:hypothetical protein
MTGTRPGDGWCRTRGTSEGASAPGDGAGGPGQSPRTPGRGPGRGPRGPRIPYSHLHVAYSTSRGLSPCNHDTFPHSTTLSEKKPAQRDDKLTYRHAELPAVPSAGGPIVTLCRMAPLATTATARSRHSSSQGLPAGRTGGLLGAGRGFAGPGRVRQTDRRRALSGPGGHGHEWAGMGRDGQGWEQLRP